MAGTRQDAGRQIVVIGAGLAGLAAAYILDNAREQVTLLEARARVGGRVYTARDFQANQHAELGAELLDAPHVHTRAHHYVRHFGLSLAPNNPDDLGSIVWLNERLYDAEDRRLWRGYENVERALANADPAGLTISAWLDAQNPPPNVRAMLTSLITAEFGDPARVGLDYFLHMSAVYADVEDDDTEVYRIAGGNDALAAAFAAALGGALRLNSPVEAVRQEADGAEVIYRGGSLRADLVIVAAPLPALRHIDFTPALPGIVQAAIRETNYAAHVKVATQYARRFWIAAGTAEAVIPPDSVYWDTGQGADGTPGILMGYHERGFNDLVDAERLARSAAGVARLADGTPAGILGARTHLWRDDPLAGGSYSAFGPGQFGRFNAALRERYGALIFAGEHTDARFPGYMEGALRSGERAARMVLER
ncbi:MAG: flavin monoamine oxidase family protein [Anaerolineales bacterium]